MSEDALLAFLSGAIIASLGLWWFRLVLKDVRKMPPITRYGVYAVIWLAYFVVTLFIIRQTS